MPLLAPVASSQPPDYSSRLSKNYAKVGAISVVGRGIGGGKTQRFCIPSGVNASMTAGRSGRALFTDGGVTNYWDIGTQIKASPAAMTWVVVFSTLATGGPDTISGTVDNATSYIEDLWINGTGESSVAGALELAIRDAAGNFRRGSTGNIGINNGAVHCVVWRLYSGTVFECFVDGVPRALTYDQTGTVTASSGLTEFPIWLFTRNLRGTGQFGSDPTQRIFAYARIPALIPNARAVSANPWQIFQHNTRSIFANSATGTLKTYNGLAKASIKTFQGLAKASTKTVNGLTP